MLEWYQAYADYEKSRSTSELCVYKVVERVLGTTRSAAARPRSTSRRRKRTTMRRSSPRALRIEHRRHLRPGEALARRSDRWDPAEGWQDGRRASSAREVEPWLIEPTFVSTTGRAAPRPPRSPLPSRAWSSAGSVRPARESEFLSTRANDPDEQRRRFEAQALELKRETTGSLRRGLHRGAGTGMGATGRVRIGVDRLVMMMTEPRACARSCCSAMKPDFSVTECYDFDAEAASQREMRMPGRTGRLVSLTRQGAEPKAAGVSRITPQPNWVQQEEDSLFERF